ncbi:MAG TPA: PilZ domain-containing protein [Pyrinomonadaceae bacterium]|nr:PilZ domain-containing protein [Pyrinomonadaceae bacterium]
MGELDRRKSDERRTSKRYAVSLEIEWENHYGRKTGTLSDVSEKGCFVLTSVDVTDGELVKIFIPLTDGMKVEFMGQVANFVSEIGFAVHFLSLTDSQKEFLASFVGLHSEDAD